MRCLSALVVLLMVRGSAAIAADFYVSPTGNDAWSGKLAATAEHGSDGPFATLVRAAEAVRSSKATSPTEPVTVFVRGGTYWQSQTLKLGREHSGSAAAPVVFRAHADERPVVVGGRSITGFAPHDGQILKADVHAQGFKGVRFRQLLCGGTRQRLARYPNFDPQNPYGGGWAYVDGSPAPMYQDVPGESKRTLAFKPQDARRWARAAEGEVFVFPRYNWWNNILRIAALDANARTLTLAGDASYAIRPGDRYFVQNLFEELDSPGEWYLDEPTGMLYFWPPHAGAETSVYAPTCRTILEFGPGAAHITFRGFTFEGCEGSAITLKDASDCLIAANTIRSVGDYNGSGVSVAGGARVGVVGNDIYDIGNTGVSLSGGDRKTLTGAEHYADNNYIHHVGVYYKQGVGVVLNGVGLRASHNLIHDGPRMGIMFSGNNLLIELNHIRHVNLETEDTGAVYTGGRDWISSRGSIIRHNYFHDILGYGQVEGKWVSPHFAWGVYLDDNAGGVDVIGNIVARASRAGIHLHNGRDNHIENNIFVDNGPQQIEYSGWTTSQKYWQDHFPTMVKGYESVAGQPAWSAMRGMGLHPKDAPLPDGKVMTGNEFYRNIVYYHDPQAKLFQFKNLPLDHYHSDNNLVFHFGLPLLTGQTRLGRVLSDNLAPNPGFEEGADDALPKGWSWQHRPGGKARAVGVGTIAARGQRSLEIEGAQGQDSKGHPQYSTIASAEIPAKPGQTYRFTAKLKADRPGVKAALLGQSYVANAYFWAKEKAETVGTDWKDCELIFTLPKPGAPGYHEQMKFLKARIDVREPQGKLWVDDVSFQEVEILDEWESWKSLGFDGRTVVADPQFVAPERDDFRLAKDSPAWALGFQSIPIEQIGPYAHALRASWPIAEAEGARERPLAGP